MDYLATVIDLPYKTIKGSFLATSTNLWISISAWVFEYWSIAPWPMLLIYLLPGLGPGHKQPCHGNGEDRCGRIAS